MTDLMCHCGEPVFYGYNGDPNDHRGLCAHCDDVRCDADPGACIPAPPIRATWSHDFRDGYNAEVWIGDVEAGRLVAHATNTNPEQLARDLMNLSMAARRVAEAVLIYARRSNSSIPDELAGSDG